MGEPTEPIPHETEPNSSKGFSLKLDKEKLSYINGVPEHLKEWILKLPETLDFKDPITLIVGENASGKTSFARAVVAALGEKHTTPRNMNLHLQDAEPARGISMTLSQIEEPRGNLISVFWEGSEIMYKSREWAKRQADLAAGNHSHSGTEHGLSSRQLFEQSINILRDQSIDWNRERVFEEKEGDIVIIFDEPEQGLSPLRQIELPKTLSGFAKPDETMIVPTNSLALYLSDLPRIDIGQPERGIFRPSKYGESGKIILHNLTPEDSSK